MIIRAIGSVLVATLWNLGGGSVAANQIIEASLPKKVVDSDIIFSGKVVKMNSSTLLGDISVDYAIVDVRKVIKGLKEYREVQVIVAGPISEADPNCCEIGSFYLFFVEHAKDSLYRSVNGEFGVYEIQDGEILDWHHEEEPQYTRMLQIEQEILTIMNRK